jgi:hypothetical protein
MLDYTFLLTKGISKSLKLDACGFVLFLSPVMLLDDDLQLSFKLLNEASMVSNHSGLLLDLVCHIQLSLAYLR